MKEYYRILKERRIEKGLTQRELADVLGVKDNAYSQYESGVRKMDAASFIKICNVLDLQLSDFMD